jgi:hypothetical protein
MLLEEAFSEFFETIRLPRLSDDRVQSAFVASHEFLVAKYGLQPHEVFIQGSYANGTAIKPADPKGEYDIDIVVAGVPKGQTAEQAISHLRKLLESDGRFKDRLGPDKPRRPCVRLRYADDETGRFHIDVVPARQAVPLLQAWSFPYPVDPAPLEVPMRGREGWRGTAPLQYTQWCNDRGPRVRRSVRELKRWRDEHDAPIASILQQVLIGTHHPAGDVADGQAIVRTLEAIAATLAGHAEVPVINNPVLPSENLADRWTPEDYQAFRKMLDEAVGIARRAVSATDPRESHQAWQELFGDDFPGYRGQSGSLPPVAPPPGHRRSAQRPSTRVEWG